MGIVAVGVLALSVGQVGIGDKWYSISYRGARIGAAVERVAVIEGDPRALKIDRCATRRFLREGTLVSDKSCLKAVVDRADGTIQWFEFEASAAGERHRVEAEWMGDRLVVERTSQRKSAREEVALPAPPRLASLVRATGGALAAWPDRATDGRRKVEEFVVDDESGAVLTIGEFRSSQRRTRVVRHDRVDESVARAPFRPVEVMRDTVLRTNVSLPADRRISRLRLRFHGSLGAMAVPEDKRQRFVEAGAAGRLLEIEGGKANFRPGSKAREPDEADAIAGRVARWRSGHSAGDLLTLVQRAADGADSPWARARLLARVVNRVLVDKGSAHLLSSAENALRTGSGDCTEHAALLSRLLDLAQLRARTVLGFAYSDRAFRLHQWVEVDVGHAEGWRALDATKDDGDVDATYVKLKVLRAEDAFFEGPTALIDLISSTRVDLVAADFGDGWRTFPPRRRSSETKRPTSFNAGLLSAQK